MAHGDGSRTWIVAALFAAAFSVFVFYVMTGDVVPPSVRAILPAALTGKRPSAPRSTPSTTQTTTSIPPRRGAASGAGSKAGPDAGTPSSQAAEPTPAPIYRSNRAPTGARMADAPPEPNGRYIPGRTSQWISVGIAAAEPLSVRSAGTIRTAEDIAGPDGLARSNYEQQLAKLRATAATDQRVVPSAPYLALIGRVCATDNCSAPFVIGNARTICAPDVRRTGVLQLWINNYRIIDSRQTLERFSSVSGGFWIYTDPAPAAACAAGSTSAGAATDASILAAGQVLKKPDFVVSSRQTDWKPFFLPLDAPLRVRATGDIEPVSGAPPTGPNGIDVPKTDRWEYPGTPAVFVDAENTLFDPALPYLGLIGRLCRGAACRRPFLVGVDRVVCTAGEPADRLELWVNQIRHPPSAMATMMPMTMETFDLQARRGEYRFDVSRAPASACGN